MMEDFPMRLSNHNPKFSINEKIGIGQQLHKWLRTGIVIGPFDHKFAKENNASLHMIFGVAKPDGTTRPLLNLSDSKGLGF